VIAAAAATRPVPSFPWPSPTLLPCWAFSFFLFLPFLSPNQDLAAQQSPSPSVLAQEKERGEGKRGGRGELGLAGAIDVPFFSKNPSERQTNRSDEDRREVKKEGVNRLGFVAVLAAVSLGEISNLNPLILVEFCGLNRLSRGCLFGVNLEIILIDLLKSHQTVLSLFLVVLGCLHGFNKICHCL
jgi:hypothetical protein